jgi:uncharacterized protein (TIGR02722 family)
MELTMNKLILILFVFGGVLTACRPSLNVNRVDPGTQTDLSGKWNDTDARMVADEMINDALTKPWLNQFSRTEGKTPTVIVGRVRNESMEHIDTEVFTKEMERAFVNMGTVNVVASSQERADIRQERIEQQQWASYKSTKALAKELGADFMLIGNINSIVDEAVDRRTLAVFYTVNLELVNVETNQKVWIGNKKIKKYIQRRNYRG